MVDTVRYVDTDAAPGGNGQSPATAYDSMEVWSANEAGTVAAGNRHIVYCSGSANDVRAHVTGWTITDAFGLVIEGNATSGVWDSSKYHIQAPSLVDIDELAVLHSTADNVQFRKLQVYNTESTAFAYSKGITDAGGGEGGTEKCIIRLVDTGNTDATSRAMEYRDVLAGSTRYMFNNLTLYGNMGVSTRNTVNCTVQCCNNTFVGGISSNIGCELRTLLDLVAINNVTIGFITPYSIRDTTNSEYLAANAADNSPVPISAWNPGSVDYANRSISFTDAANDDYTLTSSDTGLTDIGAGTSVNSAVPADDIQGDTRGVSLTSCGFDEYALATLPFNPAYATEANKLL